MSPFARDVLEFSETAAAVGAVAACLWLLYWFGSKV